MRSVLILLMSCAIYSCSNVSPANTTRKNLELSLIQHIHYGEITKPAMTKLIGKADKTVALKNELAGKEAWIYMVTNDGKEFERLGLLVDQKTGIVQSATWSVRANDSLYSKESVLSYFNYANLTKKSVGQVAKDYYSNDSIYSDSKLGLSIYIDEAKQTAVSISFGPPAKAE